MTSTTYDPEHLCAQLLGTDNRKRYLFGINKRSEKLATQHGFDGFIDEYSKAGTHLSLPILKIADIPADSVILSCSVGSPQTVKRKLDASHLHHVDYFTFYRWAKKHAPALSLASPFFWEPEAFDQDYALHRAAYDSIEQKMSDSESRQTYRDLLALRQSIDISHLATYRERQIEQYFEDFAQPLSNTPIFMDVGVYDGQTTQRFIQRYPDYQHIYLFEPETENIRKIAPLMTDERTNLFPFALSNQRGQCHFSANGPDSRLCAEGTQVVSTETLDNLGLDSHFIKVDIEGGERDFIEGAKQTILRSHPLIAIAVYHRADDLWKIPHRILSIRDDYALYLRHYMEGPSESVMYFVPKA